MVNLIMRVSAGDETATMSRSFLMKKYSHCPLKKRPVQYIKEENIADDKDISDDNSEPENLSTKPQDLSCKTFAAQPGVALISIKKENEDASDANTAAGVHAFSLGIAAAAERSYGRLLTKSGPLEPLNLNTSIDHHHPHEPTTPHVSRPRAVPAHYPPHYIPLNYIYPPQQTDALSPYYYSSPSPPQLTAIEPVFPFSRHQHRDPCSSPPGHAFTPFQQSQQQQQPQQQQPQHQHQQHHHHHHHVPVIAALPHCPPTESKLYRTQPGEHSPLSPTSTTSSTNSYTPYYPDPTSPPPVSPEDLSSPGSVSSNGGGSESGSTNGSSITNNVTTTSNHHHHHSRKSKVKDSATAPPRYKCTFCAKSYSTFSGLSKHQQFHCTANEDAASKKKFKCKYCDKEYNSLGALKMHIRTHTLPCKCLQCGKAFSRPWLLQGHIRTHTGEKPFSCPHCNRAFADRSNLRAHLQTHSDVKKYSCPTCSKTFSRMSLLSKHTDGGCPGMTHAGVIRVTDDIKSFYLDN